MVRMTGHHFTAGQQAMEAQRALNDTGRIGRFPTGPHFAAGVTVPNSSGGGNTPSSSANKPPAAPLLVTLSIPLASMNGLTLVKNHDGYWQVVAISPSSNLYTKGVHVGMVILKINNIDTATLPDDPKETGVPQISTRGEYVTLLAVQYKNWQYPGNLLTVVLQKELPDSKLGIGLMQDFKEEEIPSPDGNTKKKPETLLLTGPVFVSELIPKSFGAQSLLRVGMPVVSINNVLSVEKREAADQLRTAQGTLTVLAKEIGSNSSYPEAHYAVCSLPSLVMREHREDPGITFGTATNNNGQTVVVVEKIDPDGPFGNSKVKVGMEVVSINNFTVGTPSIAHCMLTRASQDRMVTLLARQTCQAAPGTMVTATVIKQSFNTKLGLMLGMHNGYVIVRYVREGGLLSQYSKLLEPGMILHRVNNTPVTGLHNKQVSHMLSKLRGTVTFLAEAPTSMGVSATPPSLLTTVQTATLWTTPARPDQTFGLKLARAAGNEKRRMIVSFLQDGGLAAASGLKVGMYLIAINNTPIVSATKAPEELAMNLIQLSRGGAPVTLLVQTPPMSIPPLVTGTMSKDTPDAKVGIRMKMHKERVAIINITPDSAADKLASDLLAGMLIQSVNNVDCTEKSAEDVSNLLAAEPKQITVLATTPDCDAEAASEYITAAISSTALPAENPDELFDYKDGKVFVSFETVNGLFEGTSLRKGMEVCFINNLECRLLGPAGIKALFSEATPDEEFITVLAKPAAPLAPGEVATAVIYKETADSTLGISFRTVNNNAKVIITSVANGSSASKTCLVAGLELVQINNSSCSALSVENVAKLLHDATGNVTLVVGASKFWNGLGRRMLITTTIERSGDDIDKPMGIAVRRDVVDGKNVVDSISEEGLAADSGLAKGMEVLTVNNINCQSFRAYEVEALLSSVTGTITILAERPAVPKGDLITATLVKPSPDTKVGLTMAQKNNKVLVKALVPGSLAATTDLEPGMWIKTIHNQDVTRYNGATVAKLLGAQKSVVTILAETTNETFEEKEETKSVDEDDAEDGDEVEDKGEDEGESAVSNDGSTTAEEEGGEQKEEEGEGEKKEEIGELKEIDINEESTEEQNED